MALKTYYRGSRFIKGYLIKYLKAVFYAADKGEILLTDGTKRIEFTGIDNKPTYGVWVGGALSWTEQYIPSVLISESRVTFSALSFAKDFTGAIDDEIEEDDQYRHSGGDIEVSLNLSVRARTIVEKDNLVDTVCLYLAHPDAKDFFGNHNIVIPRPPNASGETVINSPNIDFPLYSASISFDLIGQWDYREQVSSARLRSIVADIVASFDFTT